MNYSRVHGTFDYCCCVWFGVIRSSMDRVPAMVFSSRRYSRTIPGAYFQLMAHILVLSPFLSFETDFSDLRSQTGNVLLQLADKYGKARTLELV